MYFFLADFTGEWLCYMLPHVTTSEALQKCGITSSLGDSMTEYEDLLKQAIDKGLVRKDLVFPLLELQEQNLIAAAEKLCFSENLSPLASRKFMRQVYWYLRHVVSSIVETTLLDDEDGSFRGFKESPDGYSLATLVFNNTIPLEQEEGFEYTEYEQDFVFGIQKYLNTKVKEQRPLTSQDRKFLELLG